MKKVSRVALAVCLSTILLLGLTGQNVFAISGWLNTTQLPVSEDAPASATFSMSGNTYAYIFDSHGGYFGQVNSDGTVDAWIVFAHAYPQSVSSIGAAVYQNGTNGFLYGVGGDGPLTNVYVSQLNNASGNVGSWSAVTSLPQALSSVYT